MKIKKLYIENFKAISKLTLDNLSNTVLITGANGVGKSCILHALRLLKSSYGGYIANEYQNWFNEFGINNYLLRNNYSEIARDIKLPIIIEAEITFNEEEKEFIKTNCKNLLKPLIWSQYIGEDLIRNRNYSSLFESKQYSSQVNKQINNSSSKIKQEIKNEFHKIRIELLHEQEPTILENDLIELVFSIYDPNNLGIIDYHGPNRSYENSNSQNLNINLQETNIETSKNSSLYNYNNKYNNIKAEMVKSYVKALVSRESNKNSEIDPIKDLNESFHNLFNVFFENKKFKGLLPNNDGTISFPVVTQDGYEHDINDLSSGEKELLLGYVRLLNNAPKNSIIIIDEPELHLNPKMAKRLPTFYNEKIGLNFNNQIWLVTHSESLISEVLGEKDFSVFRIVSSNHNIEEQAIPLLSDGDFESTLIDLVGNISEYHPGGNIIVLEGQNTEFDKSMVKTLFSETTKTINFISAGSKNHVINVYDALNKLKNSGIIRKNIYRITDKDNDSEEVTDVKFTTKFKWDCYHIENYLLEELYILKVLDDLLIQDNRINNEKKVLAALKKIALDDIEFHVKDILQRQVNLEIQNIISYKSTNQNISKGLSESIENITQKLLEKSSNLYSEDLIKKREIKIRKELENHFEDEKWKKSCRGREVLKKFIQIYCKNQIEYNPFVNLIISSMKKDNFKPVGMQKILSKIVRNSN